MKYYAVIDTNVLVSAMLKRDSVPGNIMELVFIFYEVVMEERKAKDAYLVTGNIKHFPEKPYVVTPSVLSR